MNYAALYDRLISRARGRILACYKERHHILPRCMGGTNERANLVDLTAEEHYVAHQLLVRMHPHVRGLVVASFRMAKRCTGSRAYGWLRRRHALATSAAIVTAEHREKLRQSHLGQRPSPETLAKRAAAMRGHQVSAEARAKISAKNTGRYVGVKRPPRTVEHRQKIGAARRGRTASDEHKAKLSKALTGRHLSAEHKANIAKGQTGRKMAPDAIAKTAAARRGMKHTDEAKAKMSAALRGKKHGPYSAERRAKIAASLTALWESGKGRNQWTTPSSSDSSSSPSSPSLATA